MLLSKTSYNDTVNTDLQFQPLKSEGFFQGVPSQLIVNKIKEGYELTTGGKFQEAQESLKQALVYIYLFETNN